MKSPIYSGAAVALLTSLASAQVSPYQIDTIENIKKASRTLAFDTMTYYHGNESGQIPGVLPGPPPAGPYYWWQGGALWGTMIDYWFYTGDTSYNSVIIDSIIHQTGENRDFMPRNHTASLGNDDQGFWGMTAMLAAENKFPDPPSDQAQYLALAQAVWNTQADPKRHDENCNGGLRWQIPFSNKGYDYKNTIANGCFFNIGARLARYTGNKTYAEYAERTWDWLWGVQYIDNENWKVYDGGHVQANCTDVNKQQFSYNSAVLIQGAAYMYNFTDGEEKWKNVIDNLLDSIFAVFFPDDIIVETACEPYDGQCTTDMMSFKGYVHRWLTTVIKVAPFTREKILPILKTSAEAAVKQCTGGPSGRECGLRWHSGAFDPGYGSGAGQQMNVLAAVSSLLLDEVGDQVTADTGGTSEGDPNAGAGSSGFLDEEGPITVADKAGAGILTALILISAAGTFSWMSLGS